MQIKIIKLQFITSTQNLILLTFSNKTNPKIRNRTNPKIRATSYKEEKKFLITIA